MWSFSIREPPGMQVLVVADSGVLGLELVDVLREVEAERPEALDQPLEVLLAQRRQLARRSRRSGDGLLLLLGRRLLDGALGAAQRGAVAPRVVVRRAPAVPPRAAVILSGETKALSPRDWRFNFTNLSAIPRF